MLDKTARRWYGAKSFVVAMGYKNTAKAVAKNVNPDNVKAYSEFSTESCGTKVHAETKFLNAAGLLDLIRFSQKASRDLMISFLRETLFEFYGEKIIPVESVIIQRKKFVFDGTAHLEIFSVDDKKGTIWFNANPFAELLEYHNVRDAIDSIIERNNRKYFKDVLGSNIPQEYVGTKGNSHRPVGHLSPTTEKTLDTTPSTSLKLRSNTVFINRAGIFQLIRGSKMPKAKEFTAWIDNDVLPTLCEHGEYNVQRDAPSEAARQMEAIRQVTAADTSDSIVPTTITTTTTTTTTTVSGNNFQDMVTMLQKQADEWAVLLYDQKFAQIRMELDAKGREVAIYCEQLEAQTRRIALYDEKLAAKDHQVAMYNERLAAATLENERLKNEKELLVARYERQITEIKAYGINLENQLRFAVPNLGVERLISRDNIKENDELRALINDVKDRVAPDVSSMPSKESVLAAYRSRDRRKIQIVRGQRSYVDQIDEVCSSGGGSSVDDKPPGRGVKRSLSATRRSQWLEAEKILDLRCAKPVDLWLIVRKHNALFMYGLEALNTQLTRIRPLLRDELLQKYRDSLEIMCRKNRFSDVEKIEEFNRLGIKDENDLIDRCYTDEAEFPEKIRKIIYEAKGMMDREMRERGDGTRPDNVGKLYKLEDVFNILTVNNNSNSTNNFNFFAPVSLSSMENPMSWMSLPADFFSRFQPSNVSSSSPSSSTFSSTSHSSPKVFKKETIINNASLIN